MTQGRELEKVQGKLDRVRSTIGANEQDFRQFVRVLEGTTAKWTIEWKGFCDVSAIMSGSYIVLIIQHVQDLEEDRLSMTKDIVWAYANGISQVCVEDDGVSSGARQSITSSDISHASAFERS